MKILSLFVKGPIIHKMRTQNGRKQMMIAQQTAWPAELIRP